MKPITERIRYYTKKVADYGAVHPSKRRNPYRQERLMAYKVAMHNQIDREFN